MMGTRKQTPDPMPRLLLHVCCGPCATACIERLRGVYAVTLFFSNSNIAPETEYRTRLAQARTLAARTDLPLLEDAYDHAAWRAGVAGLEDEPEGGRRCTACFRFSLARTAARAAGDGFTAFTTTLTVSPHKQSATVFAVGAHWAAFLPVDFKKQGGFQRSAVLAAAQGLYRQDYCGCEFSLAARRAACHARHERRATQYEQAACGGIDPGTPG
jgi:epoxyqueuosine reductase